MGQLAASTSSGGERSTEAATHLALEPAAARLADALEDLERLVLLDGNEVEDARWREQVLVRANGAARQPSDGRGAHEEGEEARGTDLELRQEEGCQVHAVGAAGPGRPDPGRVLRLAVPVGRASTSWSDPMRRCTASAQKKTREAGNRTHSSSDVGT